MGWGGRRLDELKTRRDRWRKELDGSAPPDPHSSLAADDRIFPSLPCSSIAWAGLNASVSAFDRALILLGHSEPRSVDVLRELRTALVHASHALTVLAPPRRDRVLYALRVAWTAHSDPEPRSQSLAALTPFRSPLVVREVERLLAERQFSASPRWNDGSSVRVAGLHMRERAADPDLHEAVVRFVWDASGHERALSDDVVTGAEAIAGFIDRALELWEVRRAAPRASEGTFHPEGTVDTAVGSVFGSPAPRDDLTAGTVAYTGTAPGALAASTIGALPSLPGRRKRPV